MKNQKNTENSSISNMMASSEKMKKRKYNISKYQEKNKTHIPQLPTNISHDWLYSIYTE